MNSMASQLHPCFLSGVRSSLPLPASCPRQMVYLKAVNDSQWLLPLGGNKSRRKKIPLIWLRNRRDLGHTLCHNVLRELSGLRHSSKSSRKSRIYFSFQRERKRWATWGRERMELVGSFGTAVCLNQRPWAKGSQRTWKFQAQRGFLKVLTPL